MLPMDTLANEYVVTAPQRVNGSVNDNMVRITATQPNTTLTYEPDQAGAPATITNVGDYVELDATTESFLVSASESVMVAQYIVGQGCAVYDPDGSCATANTDPGDPSMLLAVPTAQYRSDYLIHAPTNYLNNFVNITAPSDANITIDGNAAPALTAIGTTGFGFVRVELPDGVQGNHAIEGDQAFGVSVYGYGDFTSYWYPGGLDLAPLPQ